MSFLINKKLRMSASKTHFLLYFYYFLCYPLL